MFVNTKPMLMTVECNALGVPVGGLIDLRGSDRIITEFSVQPKGYGTAQINAAYRNGNMDTTGSPLASWTYATGGTSAITRTTTGGEFQGGTSGSRWALDGSHTVCSLKQTVLTASRTYRVGFWAKGAAGGEQVDIVDNVTVKTTFSLTTVWTYYTYTYTTASTTFGLQSSNVASNNNAIFFIDTVTVADTTPFPLAHTGYGATLGISNDGSYWTVGQAITQANDGAVLYVTGRPCSLLRLYFDSASFLNDAATDFVRFSIVAA